MQRDVHQVITKEEAECAIYKLLGFLGEDPDREGLKETPKRVRKAFEEWFAGYKQNPNDYIKAFEDGAENIDQMIVVRNIPFVSHCEHHMAQFTGHITIGYIPNGKVLGLSKFTRVSNVFAKRLQVQERLTQQIANALQDSELKPLGVGVHIVATHSCVSSRGACSHGQETVTTALTGIFKTADVKAEFLSNCAKV